MFRESEFVHCSLPFLASGVLRVLFRRDCSASDSIDLAVAGVDDAAGLWRRVPPLEAGRRWDNASGSNGMCRWRVLSPMTAAIASSVFFSRLAMVRHDSKKPTMELWRRMATLAAQAGTCPHAGMQLCAHTHARTHTGCYSWHEDWTQHGE